MSRAETFEDYINNCAQKPFCVGYCGPIGRASYEAVGAWNEGICNEGRSLSAYENGVAEGELRAAACGHASSTHSDGRDLLEPGQHFLPEEFNAFLGLSMCHEARSPDHH